MEIPIHELSPEILDQIIEDFVLREGTDYGFGSGGACDSSVAEEKVTLEAKIAQVRRQLEARKVLLVFDPDTETCNIVKAVNVQVKSEV